MTLGNSKEFYRLKSNFHLENEGSGEIEKVKREE